MKIARFSTEWDLYPFLILGCAEAVLGMLQLAGICRSEHPDYPFTGSFYNPGPYACYLAVLLPMAVFAFRNTDHRLTSRMSRRRQAKQAARDLCSLGADDYFAPLREVRWLGTGMALACAILIPASLSRTAMIAAAIGIAIAYRDELKELLTRYRPIRFVRHSRQSEEKNHAERHEEQSAQRESLPHESRSGIPAPGEQRALRGHATLALSAIVGILIAVLVLGVGLYAVKKDSADGRLVMWKVALQAAADAPLTCVGWDNVAGAYGEAQERYFESGHGSEAEKMVADAPEYVFNEYLQVAIAFGPFALLGMLLLMGGAFFSAFRHGAYGIAGSIVATALVMTASYPLQFPLFAVTIALMLMTGFSASRFLTVKYAGVILSVSACILFLTNTEKTDARTGFACGHSLHRSRDYRKSNDILIPLMEKSADPMILNIIGKNYQELAMPDSAEHYFRKSTFRCPNRMYPHYLLMLLYTDSASFDRAKCLREAEVVLSMPVKIPSPAVEEMREKAHQVSTELTQRSGGLAEIKNSDARVKMPEETAKKQRGSRYARGPIGEDVEI